MGPFYGMVRAHLAQLVAHALRMRKAMGSSPGSGFPCLARFGSEHFLAFLVRTAPVSLRSMVSPARGMSCLRFGLRFAYELSSSAERATRRAGSKRIAWLGCARGAACLLDCLTALVLLCRFGTAVLLPRAKVPAPGRRPDVVPQAAQPVLKTRHSLGPPMLDVPASRSGREGKRDLLVALAFQT